MNQTPKVHRAMADESRARIFAVLGESDAPLGVRDLKAVVGLHASTIRAHLDVLVDAELVESVTAPPTGPGRPRLLYAPSASSPSPPNAGYRLLAEILASQLADTLTDPVATAVASGERWGSYLIERPRPGVRLSDADAVDTIRSFMDDMGFEPDVGEDSVVTLGHCPFADVARAHQDIVCSAHLGILRGALDALGSDVTVTSLEPFVAPSTCVVRLSKRP